LIVLCLILSACGQELNEPEDKEVPCGCCSVEKIEGYKWYHDVVWEYPSYLGTENQNWEEYVISLNIPDVVLFSLTTDELTEICILYPQGIYFWISAVQCYDFNILCPDWRVNMEYMKSTFNGFDELFKREDTPEVLLKRYDEIVKNIAAICSDTDIPIDIFADLELLLGNCQTNDDVEIYREILQYLMDGYHAKLMFPEIFSDHSLYSNFIARAIIIEKISPNALLSKVESPFGYPEKNTMRIIDELSNELIKR
jgi:hypothetical protein